MTFSSSAAWRPGLLGAYQGLPMDTYQSAPGESKSALDLLVRSPLDYRRWRNGQLKRTATDAMQMGSALHALVLEGREDFVVHPDTYDAPESKKAGAEI